MTNFKNRTQFILISCLLILSTVNVFAQQNFGKIKGKITTSDGELAVGVNIILKDSKYGTVSNEDGAFEFNRIRPNTYTLQVSLTGYETLEKEVIVAENKTAYLNLQLKVSNKELQEVVVSGRKSILSKKTDYVARMPISNLENPQVYSVIHKELLQEQVAVNIETAIRNSPGAVPVSFPSGGIAITFRGFSTGINARNGMETASGRSSVDLANVERIEILKGPSGTLFGSSISSYGGVVNLVTKKPFEKAATEISYTGGSFNLNRLTADVNTPLNKEKTVLFRVNLAYNNEKSFLDYGFNKTIAISPSLTYKASDKLTFNIDAELINSNNTRRTYNTYGATSGITNPAALQLDYKKTLFHDDNDAKTSGNKIFAQAEYEIAENWKSTTLFSYVGENVERSYQTYAVWSSPTQATRRVGNWGPIDNNYTNIQENINGQFSTGSIKHKFLAGINYRLNESKFSSGIANFDNIDVTTGYTIFRRKTAEAAINQNSSVAGNQQTTSIYASDVINFTDRLSAMLSLRWDYFDRKEAVGSKAYHQTALSPKLGLVYQLVKDQVSVFGNYMNGFQNMPSVEQPDASTLILDPIYANQYEFGVKAEAFNKKLSITASYYNITIDNATRTETRTGTNPGVYTLQDAKQVSKGIDIELIANPFAGLNIIAGYAYNENKLVKTANPLIDGNRAAGAPANVANLWTTYTLQNKLKGLGAGFGVNFVDKNFFATDNIIYMPSYTTCNATLFYDQPTWRVGVKLNNITNEKYWDFYGNSQAPTNLLVSLTLKF